MNELEKMTRDQSASSKRVNVISLIMSIVEPGRLYNYDHLSGEKRMKAMLQNPLWSMKVRNINFPN